MKWVLLSLLVLACNSAEPDCRGEMPPMHRVDYYDGCGWGDGVTLGDYECGYGERVKDPNSCSYTETFFCTMGVTITSFLSGLEPDEQAHQFTEIQDRASGCVQQYELVER